MGELILITGGARSGKSTFAENLAGSFGDDVLYIATAIPFDDEMKMRVKRHKEQRPAYWETLEAYKDLDVNIMNKTSARSSVMLDCITIMVTNLMFEACTDWDEVDLTRICEVEKHVQDEIDKLLHTVRTIKEPVILVTNEVGMGIVPDNVISRVFRDIAGRVNQKIAKAADQVFLCVSGIPVKIK